MKSYSKKNPYSNRFVPGLLINGSRPQGGGWIEVIPKVTCPEPESPTEPPTITIPIPALFIPTTGDAKIRIISRNANGIIINTDYLFDVMSLPDLQQQVYLNQNLGSWGVWSKLQNLITLRAYSHLFVTGIEIYPKLNVFPPIGE